MILSRRRLPCSTKYGIAEHRNVVPPSPDPMTEIMGCYAVIWRTSKFLMTVSLFVSVFGLIELQALEPRPARPAETVCPVPLEKYAPEREWAIQEKWAWDERICLGRIADLSERLNGGEPGCDVHKAEDWGDERVLTQEFVETVLLHQPFRDAYGKRGFRIRCAKFEEDLDISQSHFPHEIWFDESYFPKGLTLEHFKVVWIHIRSF